MATPVGLAVKPIGTPAEGAAGTVVTRTASARAQKAKLRHNPLLNSDSIHDDPLGQPGDSSVTTVENRLKNKAVINNAMVN